MKIEKKNLHHLNIALFFLNCMAISNVTNVLAYTPPIGIPNPGMWGTTHPIDGVAPNTATKCPNWPTAATTGCYYIDNSVTCSDSNTYGYPNNPRCSLAYGNNSAGTYAAGSYIEVHGGPYTGTNQYRIVNGTAANPVWLRGVSNAMPVFTGNLLLNNSSYLFMENLDFNGGNGGCISLIGTAVNNIVVRNSKFRNRAFVSNTSALSSTPNEGGDTHDIIYYNNEFSELGNWLTLVDQDFHAIGIDTYGRTPPTTHHNVWVLNNSFYHVSGNGVQVNANSTAMIPYIHHVYMGKNVGSACRQAPLWSKQGTDIVMSQNRLYDNRPHGPQPGNGIGYQYNPNNLWIIFNEIYDSSNGIRQSDTGTADLTHNVYIIGNKIYDIHPKNEAYDVNQAYRPGQAISLWQGNENRHIIDNTIYDATGGLNIVQSGPVDASDNIISDITYPDYLVYNLNARTAGLVKLRNNMFYDPENTIEFRWGSIYTSLSSFVSATGECSDCVVSNPLFVNAAEHDFNLSPTSPAIGKGSRNAVYDTFENLYGISIAYDFNGTHRPQGAWSLGAFEGAAAAFPPPTFKMINIK